ncbi:hypothetical protein NIES4101_71410 [Calothrix sp. NIES-4101]|nr:hypothetical protein NIES4101_71410 [Calothrix sp. NIES-4101]
MNSDLMPSSEPSKPSRSNKDKIKDQTSIETPKEEVLTEELTSEEEHSLDIDSDNAEDEHLVNRQQPIPPPSEPMQYRAIGLVRGRYVASAEQFTQGSLITVDGIELSSVLLGRIMSLVKNHLDLEQEHLWVVYPRTRQENDELHLQIVGVWEPEKLAKVSTSEEEEDSTESEDSVSTETLEPEVLTPSSEIPDGGFSVRGEVVYQTQDCNSLVIKIKQAPRKKDDKPKYFKLKIKGKLDARAVGKFWDLQVKREGDSLTIEKGEAIADLPKKRRPPFKPGAGGGGRRPFKGGGAVGSRKPFRRPPGGETPRPIKKGSADPSTAPKPLPNPSRPTPKPIKKPKSEGE